MSSDQWRIAYINVKDYPFDILTKNLPAGANRYSKVRMILYIIYPVVDDEMTRQTSEKVIILLSYDCLEGSIKCTCGIYILILCYGDRSVGCIFSIRICVSSLKVFEPEDEDILII